jgi:hypothetical protein
MVLSPPVRVGGREAYADDTVSDTGNIAGIWYRRQSGGRA